MGCLLKHDTNKKKKCIFAELLRVHIFYMMKETETIRKVLYYE